MVGSAHAEESVLPACGCDKHAGRPGLRVDGGRSGGYSGADDEQDFADPLSVRKTGDVDLWDWRNLRPSASSTASRPVRSGRKCVRFYIVSLVWLAW